MIGTWLPDVSLYRKVIMHLSLGMFKSTLISVCYLINFSCQARIFFFPTPVFLRQGLQTQLGRIFSGGKRMFSNTQSWEHSKWPTRKTPSTWGKVCNWPSVPTHHDWDENFSWGSSSFLIQSSRHTNRGPFCAPVSSKRMHNLHLCLYSCPLFNCTLKAFNPGTKTHAGWISGEVSLIPRPGIRDI